MSGLVSIDVCVASFRRPDLLAETLRSLACLNLKGMEIRVVVVDNDRDETARVTVESFRQTVSFEVVYDVEPVQNISLARNRALRHVQGDYFAFVDDDEVVPTTWLATLLNALQFFDADVVFGPVEGLLPADAPQWARSQPSFRGLRRENGVQVEHGGCGNVLVSRGAIGQSPQLFDPAYGLSGGEDVDYFYRMHLSGSKLVWCDEAVVSEYVPKSRLTLKWLRNRGFRGGQTFVRIFVRRYSLRKKVVWFVIKMLHLFGGIIIIPIMRLISYPAYIRLNVKIMGTLGQLSVVFNQALYEEYNAIRYK